MQKIKGMNNTEFWVIIRFRIWVGNNRGKMEVKKRGAQEIEGQGAGRFIYLNIKTRIKTGEVLKIMTNS